jgi:sugar O-acyltransferase (sialic acid O-acetyltransferase NeuD family)
MLKPLVIWGAKGHAKVLHEFTERLGYTLVAVFDSDPKAVTPFPGVPLHHGREGFLRWRAENADLPAEGLVAIGGQRGWDRMELQQFLREHGVMPATVVHPAAYVALNARLGRGCQVLANATVCTEARLGDACIVNTAASVDHESVVGDGVHLAPGARLAGEVRVGDYTLIAVGAVVLPRVKIGANCLIGAGAVVTKDVPDNTVFYGHPARFVRNNPPH